MIPYLEVIEYDAKTFDEACEKASLDLSLLTMNLTEVEPHLGTLL